jgi:tetratricopeptide (TPR) repeat protein
MATGCRGCGTDKEAQKAAKAKKVKKKEKKPAGKSVSQMMAENGPKGDLAKLEMKAGSAPEEAREVAPEVAAARDLILKGEATAIADGRSQLTEYLKTHETDADAHYWVGRSYMPERIVVPGIEEFTLAIQHDPEFLGARQWISVALHKEKRCADAMEHLDKVVAARPDDVTAVYDRAICEMALDQWDKAIADLTAYCASNAEPFCSKVELVAKQLNRGTGERRRMTPEERKAWKAKQEEGGVSSARQRLMEKTGSKKAGKGKAAGTEAEAGTEAGTEANE